MIHGATNDLGTVMVHYDTTVQQMSHVRRMIKRTHSRERLLSRCFDTEVGRQFHPDLKALRGHVQRGRLGTVAMAVLELQKIERPLRFGWDLQKYGSVRQSVVKCSRVW